MSYHCHSETRKVLAYIERCVRDRGYPPTLREICDHFGWGSTNAPRYHIARLVKEGRLEKDPVVSRGLRVMER